MTLSVAPFQLEAFAAANSTAASAISASGSADTSALLSAAAAAVGPIGATYLAAYGPAQANNLTGTLLVGGVHAAIGAAVQSAGASFIAADNG